MEVVPGDPGSVEHRDAGRLPCAPRAFLPCLLVELLDPFVRDGVGHEPRVRLRDLGVLVAPPANRLDPPRQGQAAVVAEHVADARFHDSMRLFVGGTGSAHPSGGSRNVNG